MPYPKITTMYECSKCRKLYAKREDAEKCEESHKCDCDKGFKYYRLGYLEPEYDSYVSSNINWEEKEIQLIYDYHDHVSVHDRRPIKYCPFCGRELKDNDNDKSKEEGEL